MFKQDLEGQQVLLAGTERALLHGLCRYLEGAGATVTTATNALIALRLLEQRAYDLLVTSAELPGACGLWLADSAAERWPTVQILILGEGEGEREWRPRKRRTLTLPQPFDLESFARAVRGALPVAL